MIDVFEIDIIDGHHLPIVFLMLRVMIPVRVPTSCARDQQSFRIDEFLILVGWSFPVCMI